MTFLGAFGILSRENGFRQIILSTSNQDQKVLNDRMYAFIV